MFRSDGHVGADLVCACFIAWAVLRAGQVRAEDGRARAPASGEAAAAPPTEIVVRGKRPPRSHSHEAPTVASTVVEGEDLRRQGQSTADVLERVSGVQISRAGASSDLATASLRGADARQTPVYLAGIRLNDDVSGTADLSAVPLFMIDRVEVFRGNAPERADRLGIGGAVFLWPRVPRRTRAGAGIGVGSYGHRSGWLAYEAGSASASSLVAVRRSQADNDYPFIDDRGLRFDRDDRVSTRRNADFVTHDAWALGRVRIGQARVETIASAFDREQGVTGISVVPAERARARTRRLLLGTTLSAPCASEGACALELSSSFLGASAALVDPAAELPAVRAPRLDDQGRRFTQRGAVTWRPTLDVAIGTSVVHAHERILVTRAIGVPHRGRRDATRVATRVDWDITPDLHVSGLGAAECHTTEGQGERYGQPLPVGGDTCGVLEPTGRAGASYTVASRVELLANVGRYVRVPTLGELLGTSAFVAGSEALRAEKGVTVDAGVRASAGAPPGGVAYAAEVFAFSRWADDLVRYRRSSANALAPFNVASARVRGVELGAAADLVGWVRVDTAATLLDAMETTEDPVEDPTTNDILPFASRLTLAARLEAYQKPRGLPLGLDRIAVGVSDFYRSSRFADSAGLIVLPEQHRVDVDGVVSLSSGAILVRARVANVLDRLQSDLLGMPLPGRTFGVGLEAWF